MHTYIQVSQVGSNLVEGDCKKPFAFIEITLGFDGKTPDELPDVSVICLCLCLCLFVCICISSCSICKEKQLYICKDTKKPFALVEITLGFDGKTPDELPDVSLCKVCVCVSMYMPVCIYM